MSRSTIIFLFDVNQTLTIPGQSLKDSMVEFLSCIKLDFPDIQMGIVSGSDLDKIQKQIDEVTLFGKDDDDMVPIFEWIFAENGVMSYHHGEEIGRCSIIEHLGEENYQKLINSILKVLSKIQCPKKRSLFIECRTGIINISPIGRNCTLEERKEFIQFDNQYQIREQIITKLSPILEELKLKASIGGQISIDIFPLGWDKSFCLQYLPESTIHFFGDKTGLGGNDYEIYNSFRVIGHTVTDLEDTQNQVLEILQSMVDNLSN